jgi:O-antigen/teichoic acid export membrane protein
LNLSEANKWASAVARRILHRQPSMSWNAAQIYFYQFLAILLGLVSNIIIARLLGPKEKGVYDLYVLLSNFISEIGTLGFGYGLLYYLLSQCRAIAEVHGTGLVFSAVMGLVTAAIGFSGLAILRSSFQGLPDWIILLCFFSSPFLYYRIIWGNLLLGIELQVTKTDKYHFIGCGGSH